MLLTITSFLFFTAAVAVISYFKTKGEVSSAKGYFLAGRGLSAIVIASSMVLTSLSTEQLVGTNASSYAANFSIMAWTVMAIIPLVVLALYLLPRYLKGGFSTIPEFFEERYDQKTRRLMSMLFLLGYTFVLIPGSLYSGAIAFTQIFDITGNFGISLSTSIWILTWVIGIVGGLYAVFGGLKAVAISDTINGIGLLIGGLSIPFFAFLILGDGSLTDGLSKFFTAHPEKLNAIGSATDPVPWLTILTGVFVVNFFYWSTNQAIVQRSLAAKSLATGQKGILMAGIFLLLLPLILNVPGVLSHIMFGDTLAKIDLAYPALVGHVLPKPLLGFFCAAIFGAILSTFNSFVNSAATLFCLDIYKPKFKPNITDEEIIRVAKIAGTVIALISMCIAPLLLYGSDGLFLLLRRFAGFFNIPVIALVAIGFLNKTVSGKSARISVYAHIILYFLLIWVFKVKLNFMHILFILFVFDILFMLLLNFHYPREKAYVPSPKNKSNVDLTPWKYSKALSITLICALAFLYLVFSPIGIACKGGVSPYFLPTGLGLGIVWAVLMIIALRKAIVKYGTKKLLKQQTELN